MRTVLIALVSQRAGIFRVSNLFLRGLMDRLICRVRIGHRVDRAAVISKPILVLVVRFISSSRKTCHVTGGSAVVVHPVVYETYLIVV